MDPATAVRTCLGKYADLTGRAGRGEHWWFSLAVLLVVVGVPVVGGVLVEVTGASSSLVGNVAVTVLSPVWFLVVLGLAVPSLAAGVRRLHDTGRPGWWWLLALTGIGVPVLLVLLALPGTPGPNRFSADTRTWPARESG